MPAPRRPRIRHARLSVALGVLCAAVVWLRGPGVALADAKQECSDAYYQTQILRDASDLEGGIAQADICTRDVCAQFIRDACAGWKADLEARVASVVVEAVDGAGAVLTEGTVTLDGKLWLDRLDGAARVVPEGPHTIELTVPGADPQKKEVVVRAGEKNRKITIALPPKAPVAPPEEAPSIGPWIVGGVGVAALIGSAVTGGFVIHAYVVTQDECDDATRTCSRDGADAQAQGRVLGPVTTSLMIGGGVLLAAGILWLVIAPGEPDPTTTSWFVVPAVSHDQQGVVLGGSW